MTLVAETAHALGMVPVAVLAVQRSRNIAHWWLAAAFGVSFVADSVAHVVAWPFGSLVYPAMQAGLVSVVFLSRKDAAAFIASLGFVGVLAAIFDASLLLRTVAWGGVVGMVIDRPPLGMLRGSLLVYFGLGLLAWYAFNAASGWATWLAYQGTRIVGLGLFVGAVTQGRPRLVVA